MATNSEAAAANSWSLTATSLAEPSVGDRGQPLVRCT
jgi:hypothetical protein